MQPKTKIQLLSTLALHITHNDCRVGVEPVVVGGPSELADIHVHAPVVRPVVCPASIQCLIIESVKIRATHRATMRRSPAAFAAATVESGTIK